MISINTVPPNWQAAVAVLSLSPTGAGLLSNPALASATVVGGGVLGGGTASAARVGNNINVDPVVVPQTLNSAIQMASTLAHEMTHAIDFAFWRQKLVSMGDLEDADSEISAHYNQGLVLRDLGWTPAGMTLTFAAVHAANSRFQVINYLLTTAQYGTMVRALSIAKPFFSMHAIPDRNWEFANTFYHCHAHLSLNSYGGMRGW